ncbi:MAG: hypothetical protein M1510_01640 [Nitrospirae bacterium]|nr:hypothetical protein [Nitrospirota bacterium]
MANKISGSVSIGIKASAPVFGVIISLWFGVIAFKLGLDQGSVAVSLAMISILLIIVAALKDINASAMKSVRRAVSM